MTAKEMAAAIKSTPGSDVLWEHPIGNGVVVRVRRMPQRLFGSWYLVWATRRRWDENALQETGRGWTGEKLTAMSAKTAGEKARALVTRHGQ